MGQVGTVASWNAHTHPQEEASIQGRTLFTQRAARPRISQEDRNLDFNVKVSWPLWRTAQIVKVQHVWLHVVWLFGDQTKDYQRVKFNHWWSGLDCFKVLS